MISVLFVPQTKEIMSMGSSLVQLQVLLNDQHLRITRLLIIMDYAKMSQEDNIPFQKFRYGHDSEIIKKYV